MNCLRRLSLINSLESEIPIDFGLKMKTMGMYTVTGIKFRFYRLTSFFLLPFSRIFTKEEIAELRKITLWDIIVNSTNINPSDIQRNVFIFQDGDPCPQPLQLNATELEPCSYLQGYDYFSGSELAFIYACVFLGFVPILCAFAGYGVVKLQNSKRRKLKIRQEALRYEFQISNF